MYDGVDSLVPDDFRDKMLSPKSPTTNFAMGGTAQRDPVERLSKTTTFSSAAISSSTAWLPMYPAPPVTSVVIADSKKLFSLVVSNASSHLIAEELARV